MLDEFQFSYNVRIIEICPSIYIYFTNKEIEMKIKMNLKGIGLSKSNPNGTS